MSGRHLGIFFQAMCLGLFQAKCLRGMLRCPGDILAFFLGKMSERHVQMSGGHVK